MMMIMLVGVVGVLVVVFLGVLDQDCWQTFLVHSAPVKAGLI